MINRLRKTAFFSLGFLAFLNSNHANADVSMNSGIVSSIGMSKSICVRNAQVIFDSIFENTKHIEDGAMAGQNSMTFRAQCIPLEQGVMILTIYFAVENDSDIPAAAKLFDASYKRAYAIFVEGRK
jgi:hypothetical protein